MELVLLIQPTQPVPVFIKIGSEKYECQMVSLSPSELVLSSEVYLDKETEVGFVAKFFRGKGTVIEVHFKQKQFTYKLKINSIQYQPGLLINTKL